LLWIHFWELRFWEDELANAKDSVEITKCLEGLQNLNKAVAGDWVKNSDLRHYYNLQRCVASAIGNAQKQLAK
jgi:hypothetical protein